VRVVQLSALRDPLRRYGAELLEAWPTVTGVARAAADAGMEVTVVHAGWRDEVLEHAGVPVHFVAESGGSLLPPRLSTAVPLRLLARVRALRPDVVHFHGLGFPLPTRMAAGLGAPVLVQDHANRLPPPARRALHRWGLARIAGATFTARELARPFAAAGMLPPGTPVFEVLESSNRLTPGDPEAARAAAGVYGDPCVLSVARLNEGKDPLTVLDAFERAAPRLPDAHLWMAYGEAPMLDTVRARVEASPVLRGRVHLLGFVPHERIQDLCRAADLFVSASLREGGGYAVLEALACGATPLITDIPTHHRITHGGRVGALFPVRDADALAGLIIAHAGGNRQAARVGVREHFERHLSFAAVGRELRYAYEQIARRP
jgi:glycosyltransferase involved in cell wall biosynthesis